ncbi:MAG: hypothetical protein FWD38_01395 [Oscillospiraceae bacterium]|nr:hypothetical protein [Oscillospiraceae bacterium]
MAGISCAVVIMAYTIGCTTNDSLNNHENGSSSSTSGSIVGSVRILSNGIYYEPFKRMVHAGGDGLSASGEPLDIESIAGDLLSIHIGDDFQVIVEGKSNTNRRFNVRRFVDGSWVRKLLVPADSDYTLMDSVDDKYSEMFYTGSFIDVLEPGESIISFEERWGTSVEYVVYEYLFKIIID